MYYSSQVLCFICGKYMGEKVDDALDVQIKCPYCSDVPQYTKKQQSGFEKNSSIFRSIFDTVESY